MICITRVAPLLDRRLPIQITWERRTQEQSPDPKLDKWLVLISLMGIRICQLRQIAINFRGRAHLRLSVPKWTSLGYNVCNASP